jgi:hypothetical protein
MIEFSDGMKFDTSGEYRVESRSDGLYVVGHGMLAPVRDQAEGDALIAQLTQKREGRQ